MWSIVVVVIAVQLKEILSKHFEKAPVSHQRLIFAGKVLKDNTTLKSQGIIDGLTIHLVVSPTASRVSLYVILLFIVLPNVLVWNITLNNVICSSFNFPLSPSFSYSRLHSFCPNVLFQCPQTLCVLLIRFINTKHWITITRVRPRTKLWNWMPTKLCCSLWGTELHHTCSKERCHCNTSDINTLG